MNNLLRSRSAAPDFDRLLTDDLLDLVERSTEQRTEIRGRLARVAAVVGVLLLVAAPGCGSVL